MHGSHKLSLIMDDAESAEIARYPVAAVAGWKIAVDGVPMATIKQESVVFHKEEHVLRYIASQAPPAWHPCAQCTDPMDCGSWASCINPAAHKARPAVEIDPKAADLRIEVAHDGVSIGLFAEDGRVALLNLDALSAGAPVSSEGRKALAEWANDRRKQANATPA